MNSPFKFLNAYEKKDNDIFFGRDKEIELLYETTFKANLILIYGQSGTGKTSLIQCGLANRFRKTDWFEIFIRRRGNINTSLQRELRKKAGTSIEELATIVESIKSLYLDFLRPVYLIFDQFEELITLGSKSEQQVFFNTVAEVLKSGVSCKILIVMREEYIAYLYDYEQIVPGLFDNRIRIEPMHSVRVDEVIRGSCKKFEIEIVNPDETVQEIIENNKNSKGEIQLLFLQVYLDRLFRYAAWKSGEGKPVKFTLDLVKKIGKMSDVMTDFLNEQVTQI
ncbi:ATP-binding protein [Acidobacteriota bacterium]